MKTLKDLKLTERDKRQVAGLFLEWMAMLMEKTGGVSGNVLRADFESRDGLFFFTDCRDVVSETLESKGQEADDRIRARKGWVLCHVMLRAMLGEDMHVKIPCTHCGNPDMELRSCRDGFGYYKHCQKCRRIVLDTYEDGIGVSTASVIRQLNLFACIGKDAEALKRLFQPNASAEKAAKSLGVKTDWCAKKKGDKK